MLMIKEKVGNCFGFLRKLATSNYKLLIILSVSILVIFSPIYLQNKPFFLFNDQVVQYNIFYKEWLRLVNNFLNGGSFPFYSWYKFLGSDFYSSQAYYTVGDVFLPLLLQFKNIETALFVESILLIYISAFNFKYFLRKFGINNQTSLLIVPFVYALNGLVGLYLGNYMFHRFYAFLPLLFAGVELYISKKKYLLFILSVSLLFLQSFYLMFPISLFLAIYVVFSYSYKKLKTFSKDFLVSNLKLIFYYLLGFGMIAILMFPTIIAIRQSPRLEDVQITQWFWSIKVLLGMIVSFNSGPLPIMTSIPNIFQVGLDGHMFWYSFYVSSTFIGVLITFALSKSINKKPFLYTLLSIFFIINFLPVNSVFHGFAVPTVRLCILYTFFILLFVAYAIENVDFNYVYKGLIKYNILFYAVILLCIAFGYINFDQHWQHLLLLISFSVLGLLGNFITRKKEFAIILFVVLEITLNLTLHIYYSNKVFYKFNDNLIQDYMDYYQEIDSDLIFRTYVDPKQFLPSTSLNLNQSMAYSYMSVSTYDSFYEPNLKEFLHLNGIDWHIIHLDDPVILKMLGVKYYLVYDESEIPESINYEYTTTINHLKIYQDLDYLPIGFTYSNFQVLEDTDTFDDWLDIALVYEKDLSSLDGIVEESKSLFKVVNKYSNGLFGTIDLKSKQLLFLSIPYNKGWEITVDNQTVEPLKVQGGFIGIILDAGYHEIGLKFKPDGIKLGAIVSLVSMGILALLSLITLTSYLKRVKI